MEAQSIPLSVHNPSSIHRRDFPPDFIFGAASAAYQYEGAANEYGRGPSIWDFWTQRHPGKMVDCSNGNVAIDSYHRFKEDVKIMKKIGLDAYRFSISWSRLLPSGKLSGGVNKEGVNFYNDFIDELVANGIEPFVTLFHWDLPQALENEYGGFLSPRIIADYVDFAELCFWEFGDRVKNWATCNEPWTYTVSGYVLGNFPPGRGPSSRETMRSLPALCRRSILHTHICTDGNPATEPYRVAHHLLLSHAAAVEKYRTKYQTCQRGKIGIVLNVTWLEPFSEWCPNDRKAAERGLDFKLGWFLEPVINGDYPQSMQNLVKQRLPKFSEEESKLLKGSFDFIGINYYTSNYAKDAPQAGSDGKLSYNTDSKVEITHERKKDVPIGPLGGSNWVYLYPEGIYRLLDWMRKKYNNPLVYITENGVDDKNDTKLTLSEARHDETRRDYHEKHLRFLHYATHEGANVKGYFAWSFMDNFEWSEGYSVRFGMIYIDYKNDLARYPKDSAIWYKNFLTKTEKTKKRQLDHKELDNIPQKK
uniref:Putative strictosidine beta-D-glucosidase n=1 Tax=Camptotheca acuminata TaxID=16922 RepID=G8E0P8_CAMAC|nr:putative strictosidine beta-D-glucosidase [Camptotheca acuminata]